MDFKKKKFFSDYCWLKNITLRNVIILFHYTKIRFVGVTSLIIMLIVSFNRDNMDGLSNVLYGLQYNDDYKHFPISWFLFILSPILIAGDAPNSMLKQDFKMTSLLPYPIHIISNGFVLCAFLSFSYAIDVLFNHLTIYNGFFLGYLFIFHIWLLILFQLFSTFFIQPFIAIILISSVLIIDIYIPIMPIINETMFSRFNSDHFYSNLGILFIILFLTILMTKLKINSTDFIKGVGN